MTCCEIAPLRGVTWLQEPKNVLDTVDAFSRKNRATEVEDLMRSSNCEADAQPPRSIQSCAGSVLGNPPTFDADLKLGASPARVRTDGYNRWLKDIGDLIADGYH